MMKIAKWSIVLFLFSACAMGNAYVAEISQLKELISEVEKSKEDFKQIDFDQASAVSVETKTIMNKLTKKYKGELSKEQASIVNDFNNVKRLLKDFDRQHKRVNDEFERTNSQLNALLSTLQDGNTVDASGNQIDVNYVSKQMGIETKVAQSLIREVDEFSKRCDRALNNYTTAKPAMENLLNELLP